MRRIFLASLLAGASLSLQAQETKPFVSRVWVSDLGDGRYQNPVLHADYSDPDAIRVGSDYYMVSSSFENAPGLPVLHSRDLVNWTILSHALPRQVPEEHFALPRHGEGVWAPAIRYHNGHFYIFYPDPDFGIYMTKAVKAEGPWSEPVLVTKGKGLIDPCPFWDDDGKAYLVHAFAGSRAGIKSLLAIKRLQADGTKTLDEGVLVFDGHELDPTVEGPKLYKRNGYYYIFAPAGGVATGWQLVLRSRNIYGPYERKVVMDQGSTTINGPHQGAWVNTPTGEDWFLHFQDKGVYGRVVHLQPMQWNANWPVIGVDPDGDGKGAPVTVYRKPNVGKGGPVQTPADSDEFNTMQLGKQWQWMANPKAFWHYMDPAKGVMRLFSSPVPDSARNLWDCPQVLVQKFPAETFVATTKLRFYPQPKLENERVGLTIIGFNYAGLALRSVKGGVQLLSFTCKGADKGARETEEVIKTFTGETIYFRVAVAKEGACRFFYSEDGNNYIEAGKPFVAEVGRWIGARIGIFCTRNRTINDAGWASFDWFRIEK